MTLPSQSIGRRKCVLFDEEICVHFCYQKMRHEMMSCIWFWPSELKKQLCSLPHSKFQTEVWFVFEAMWPLKTGLKVLTRNSKVRFWIFMLLQHWSPIFWDGLQAGAPEGACHDNVWKCFTKKLKSILKYISFFTSVNLMWYKDKRICNILRLFF